MPPILQIDAGSVDYSAAYEWQRRLHSRRVVREIPDVLLLLEHPHVFSLGRSFRPEHLLASPDELRRRGVAVHEADRGGSITYHGPGQLVAYPVVDLRTESKPFPDVIAYLRQLEAATLETVRDFGIPATLRRGLTGIWVGTDKLAAIGVNVSRGVTKHGMALNVSTDLDFFSSMVPCGIPDAGVTSMERLLGSAPPAGLVASVFAGHLAEALGLTIRKVDLEEAGLPPRTARERVGV
jgi:lipoyl(octanoyl) transferase